MTTSPPATSKPAPTPQDNPQLSSTAPGGEHSESQSGGETSRESHPKGKASFTDKIRGKAERVIGKQRKNPELEERGRLRETEGKAAATGEAKPASG